jgi:hypothetical protein
MSTANWQIVEALATVLSAIAIIAGSVFVMIELRQAKTDRNFAISSHLFELWQSTDFQMDQLFLLHGLNAVDWDGFIGQGRGNQAERAMHRVGGFYDRVGHLVLSGLIKQDDILPTIGGDAVAVWTRIEPIVRAARAKENPYLFKNYEAVLPSCIECYYPNLRPEASPTSHSVQLEAAAASPDDGVKRIEPHELFALMREGKAVVLDVSAHDNSDLIAGAVRPRPNDLNGWLRYATGHDRTVALYCT